MRVVICGGGVIGACIAYFLGLRGIAATVVERSGVANAASGKSGGFLALDWCDGSALGPLARRSFALHAELATELATELGADWGYRRVDTIGVAASARRSVAARPGATAPDWLGPQGAVHGWLGTVETTAQVHPAAFTRGMMDAAIARGATLHDGTVTGIALSGVGSAVVGVEVDGETLAADAVVIAMGPWSVLASQWLPLPAVYGLKGHSLVFRYVPSGSPHAAFVEYETAQGDMQAPEVYPRPDGTTYVCGLSSQAALPADPAQVAPDDGAHERLRAITAEFAPTLGRAEVLAAQACYRPVTRDGLPLIGVVPGVAGAYVATGHSVWGMLNAPATGEVMAALIAEGSTAGIDIAPFDPARLPPLPPDALHTTAG
jgi:glycine/D-amino acid oxidase-like deaminating enzyme